MIYETVNEEVTTVVMWVVQIITYQGGGEGGGGRGRHVRFHCLAPADL